MKKYVGENIQYFLMTGFNKNNLIDFCWGSSTRRKLIFKNTLKSEVLNKWIKICGNGFLRA